MINNFKEVKKETEKLNLKLDEIKDYMIRSFVDEFNKTNDEIQLTIINGYDNYFIDYRIKQMNGNVYENEYDIDNLTFKNIIRKGKISIDSKNEYGKHTYKSIDLVYTDKFKESYSDFLKIYKEQDFKDLDFDSRKPKIYKVLKNQIEKSLNNDVYLESLINESKIFEIKNFLSDHNKFLMENNSYFAMYYKDDKNKDTHKTFDINEKFIEKNLNVINNYNFRDYSIRYIKDLILKSNIFNDKTKANDILFQYDKKDRLNFKDFNELNNCIRNELQFSPEKSLKILTYLVDLNKKPSEINESIEKLKLLSNMGCFSLGSNNNSLESYNNNENIINNINDAYKSKGNTYLKRVTKVLSFVEQKFEIIQNLQDFYENIKNKEYEFTISNFKTKESYVDKITFDDFFNKYVLEKKDLENNLELN